MPAVMIFHLQNTLIELLYKIRHIEKPKYATIIMLMNWKLINYLSNIILKYLSLLEKLSYLNWSNRTKEV